MVIGRVEALEMKYNDLEKKNESLHQDNAKLQKMVKDLTVKLETKEAEYNKMAISQVDSSVHADDDRISVTSQNCEQVEEFSAEIKNKFLPQKFTGGELVPYNNSNPMDYIRQVEEKTLEVERTLNILSVHHSELELQLQASLASTHNGAFLWRILEMRRRIHDAKIGRITSIYSPPFYT